MLRNLEDFLKTVGQATGMMSNVPPDAQIEPLIGDLQRFASLLENLKALQSKHESIIANQLSFNASQIEILNKLSQSISSSSRASKNTTTSLNQKNFSNSLKLFTRLNNSINNNINKISTSSTTSEIDNILFKIKNTLSFSNKVAQIRAKMHSSEKIDFMVMKSFNVEYEKNKKILIDRINELYSATDIIRIIANLIKSQYDVIKFNYSIFDNNKDSIDECLKLVDKLPASTSENKTPFDPPFTPTTPDSLFGNEKFDTSTDDLSAILMSQQSSFKAHVAPSSLKGGIPSEALFKESKENKAKKEVKAAEDDFLGFSGLYFSAPSADKGENKPSESSSVASDDPFESLFGDFESAPVNERRISLEILESINVNAPSFEMEEPFKSNDRKDTVLNIPHENLDQPPLLEDEDIVSSVKPSQPSPASYSKSNMNMNNLDFDDFRSPVITKKKLSSSNLHPQTSQLNIEQRTKNQINAYRNQQKKDERLLADKNQVQLLLNDRLINWENINGAQKGLRSLLSSIGEVLWEDSGYNPPSISELVTPAGIKKAYLSAIRFVHPDKMSGDKNMEHRVIAEYIFEALNLASKKYNNKH